MSTNLGLHDPTKVRVFKLASPESGLQDLKNFLAGHISLIILGEFERSRLHITSANRLCLDGHDAQAVLWIKDAVLLDIVKPYLSAQVSNFSEIEYEKVLALSFKMNSADVAFLIEKNPDNIRKRMSKLQMFKAFAAATEVVNS